ncbi:MAG: carboxypeptidase-like regulatory domain-containing protein [Flavobacteriaceae bacterium]
MRKTLTLNIPKPCHEDWNKMTPQEKGRHCSVCQKKVFDFTTKTDEAIIKTFEQEGNVCGRYLNSQLNRTLILSRKEKNSFASLVASGLLALLSISSQNLSAQEKPKTVKLDTILKPTADNKIISSIVETKLIEGTVVDDTKMPLPGVYILIKGTNIGTQSDFDGNFGIKVKQGDVLIFSYVGMETKQVNISDFNNLNIELEMSEFIMGEMVVMGAIQKQSSYITNQKDKRYRIRNGEIERTSIGKFLFKITNVFRKKDK